MAARTTAKRQVATDPNDEIIISGTLPRQTVLDLDPLLRAILDDKIPPQKISPFTRDKNSWNPAVVASNDKLVFEVTRIILGQVFGFTEAMENVKARDLSTKVTATFDMPLQIGEAKIFGRWLRLERSIFAIRRDNNPREVEFATSIEDNLCRNVVPFIKALNEVVEKAVTEATDPGSIKAAGEIAALSRALVGAIGSWDDNGPGGKQRTALESRTGLASPTELKALQDLTKEIGKKIREYCA